MVDGLDRLAATDAAWGEAVARAAVIRRLVGLGRIPRTEVSHACRELGIGRSRLYELINAWRAKPVTSSLLPRPAGTRPGIRRLESGTEQAIDEALRVFLKMRPVPGISRLHGEIRRICRAQGLRAPSWHTVKSRLMALDPAEIVRVRDGLKAMRDRFCPVPGTYMAGHAYEVVQIDHTLVDIIVVDRVSRQPLQRPWLTLAIDVASRMVAGFHLTLEPPSTMSVALAIQNLVMPKRDWLARYGLVADWPAEGLPDAVHLDNAREFRSRTLQRSAEEYGIDLIYRPVATPHYGGHIERLIGTMMGTVHLLPGTTFSNVAERRDYDSAAEAALTLDELEHWLALEITRYHASVHGALGLPPIAAWEDAVAQRREALRRPHDPARFLIDFLPSQERVVRRDGIHLFGIRYWDDILNLWAGRLDRPLRVSYDPRDLSRVFLHAPDGAFWPIRYADLRRPPITLGEHRQARAALRERGRALVNEQLLFETVEQQRAMVDEATKRTKSARRQAERRERGLGAVQHVTARETDIREGGEADEFIDWNKVPIFPVEEWS